MSANGQNLNKKWSKLPREIKKREYHAQFWLILEKSHAFLRLFSHGSRPAAHFAVLYLPHHSAYVGAALYHIFAWLARINLRGLGSDAAISEA